MLGEQSATAPEFLTHESRTLKRQFVGVDILGLLPCRGRDIAVAGSVHNRLHRNDGRSAVGEHHLERGYDSSGFLNAVNE